MPGQRQPLEALPRGRSRATASRANTGSIDNGARGRGADVGGELLDLLPGARLDRPVVRRRRRQGRTGATSGARARASTAAARSSRACSACRRTRSRVHFARGRRLLRHATCRTTPAHAAALMSQLAGKPVRVQLMRDQSTAGTSTARRRSWTSAARSTRTARSSAYDYVSYQQPWVFSRGDRVHVRHGRSRSAASAAPTLENAGSQYKIANHRVLGTLDPERLGLPKVAYLRAPAAPQALFASEQMIDELAYAAGHGPGRVPEAEHRELPVARRARGGGEARRAGRRTVGELERPTTGRIRKGRGDRDRRLREHASRASSPRSRSTRSRARSGSKHVYAAHDCGLIVNPNMVEQQVEGCVDPGRQPRADRGGHVLEEPRHDARLGVVPDPPVQGRAGDHDRAPEPAGAALERARASPRRRRSPPRSRTRSSTRRASGSGRCR